MTLTASGHSIANSGSFQRNPCSSTDVVDVADLIENLGVVGKSLKTVRNVRWKKQRSAIVGTHLNHHVLAVAARVRTHVDGHADNGAPGAAHQRGHGVRSNLTVDAAQSPSGVVIGNARLRDVETHSVLGEFIAAEQI